MASNVPNPMLKEYQLIVPNLYLSNLSLALDPKRLKQLNIRRVLTIADPKVEERLAIPQHIQYITIDNKWLLVHFEDTFRYISDAQNKGMNEL